MRARPISLLVLKDVVDSLEENVQDPASNHRVRIQIRERATRFLLTRIRGELRMSLQCYESREGPRKLLIVNTFYFGFERVHKAKITR